MELSFAPMEGITYSSYRRIHSRLFGGADRYYAPFIAPNADGSRKHTSWQDILPENNAGIKLIPQILCNSAKPFLILAEELKALGYDEVNLNAGCPSGTVVSKFKGSGMLRDLESMERCLDEIFSLSPLPVSIKTRMGILSTEEFPRIMELYRKYPIKLLSIHARDRAGMYKSAPDPEAFAKAAADCPFPLEYNGNVFSSADAENISGRFTGIASIMIGRGAIANPALFREAKGGEALKAEEFRRFHDELLEEYLSSGLQANYAMARMKELWSYFMHMFPGGEKAVKSIFKSRSLPDYQSAVSLVFSGDFFDPASHFVAKY